MNKYVIAFWSDHTGELLQELVEAESELKAATSYLDIDPAEFTSMEMVYQYCANCDTMIKVLQVDKRNWRNFTEGGTPAQRSANPLL